MPWARFDELFHQHPKVVALSDRAFRMFVCSITWSNANLTDGQIPSLEQPGMRPFLALLGIVNARHARAPATELVRAGLWITTPEGFQVHDFLKYQPSKLDVEREREAARVRQARRRRSLTNNGDVTASRAVSHAVTPPEVTASVRDPVPARTVPAVPAREDLGLTLSEGSGLTGVSEPDVFDVEELVDHRFGEVLDPELHPSDQRHLWLKACRANRLFADVWPGVFAEIREEHGEEALTETLRRLVDRDLAAVNHPRAFVLTLAAETVAGDHPDEPSSEGGEEQGT